MMKREYETLDPSFKGEEAFGLQKEDKKGYKEEGEKQRNLLSKLNLWHQAEKRSLRN